MASKKYRITKVFIGAYNGNGVIGNEINIPEPYASDYLRCGYVEAVKPKRTRRKPTDKVEQASVKPLNVETADVNPTNVEATDVKPEENKDSND